MIQPKIFGKFILLERVSVGGMAEVYRAKLLNAPEFERFFAIKRILPHLAADKDFVSMFINEAKVAVELEHPNVCQIYELGRLGQSHYIAMEYIAGRDVEAIQAYYRSQKKIMSVSQACFIIVQAAQGLDYAHRAVDSSGQPLGLVHRDVSPQNLLVTYDGVVKLIDFGVSKASRKPDGKSDSGVIKGKFSYLSPEQAMNLEIDHRSDVFALGVVFWELLTGRRLFQSESELAIIEMITECKIEKPSHYNSTVPEAVDRICMKALEKDVTKRYAWAGEMVMELLDFLNGCKTPFTQWHLQTWMCKAFESEFSKEWEKIPIFKGLNTPEDIDKYNQEHEEEYNEAMKGTTSSSSSETKPSEQDKSKEQEKAEEGSGEKSAISEGKKEVSAERPAVPGRRHVGDSPKPERRKPPIVLPSSSKLSGGGTNAIFESVLESKADSKDNKDNKDNKSDSFERKNDSLITGVPKVGSISKSLPNVKSVNLGAEASPDKDKEEKKSEEAGDRLSVSAPVSEGNDDDVELVPEGVDPTVSDPQIIKLKREEKKARTRKGLLIFILVICLGFVVLAVMSAMHVIKLPVRAADLPTAANLSVDVSPVSDGTRAKLYPYPKGDSSVLQEASGSAFKFEGLKSGIYTIEMTMPGYESETYTVTLENGNSQTHLDMTNPLPQRTTYRVNVNPADAQVFLNGELVEGSGAQREIEGIVGESYSLRVFKLGYESRTQSGSIEKDMSLNFELPSSGPVGVLVSSEPTRSEVYLYDAKGKAVRQGFTPMTLENVDVTQPLKIEVRRMGIKPWVYELDFTKVTTEEIRVFADMEP